MPRTPNSPRAARALALALVLLCATAGLVTPAPSSARSSAAAPVAPPAAPQAGDVHFIREVRLVTKDIVVDRSTQTVYASVPSTVGANGNSITPINTATGTVGQSVFIGSEPSDLDISEDGRTIYAALDGASAVRRFDVPTLTAGLQFSVGKNQFGEPVGARQVKIAPGAPGTVAAAQTGSSFSSGVAVYDDGVRRGNVLANGAEAIAFSAVATRMYASVTSFSAGIQRINVTPSGPVNDGSPAQVPTGGEIKFDGGRLYTATGRVIDPEAGTLLGTFTAPDLTPTTASVAPDSQNGRVYFVSTPCCPFGDSPTTVTLRAFDMNTFVLLGSVTITGARGAPSGLARWGANGLAFRTADRVYLIQTTLVPSAEPVPSPTPTPTPSPTPAPSPTPTPFPGEVRAVQLVTNDLVIDPSTELIYASVPSSAGAGGNSVTRIDPVAGAAGPPVFVGSEPKKMAISGDGQTIYVALDGANAVRRFDVPTLTAGLQFAVGNDQFFGPLAVEDMEVAPGNPQTVAISRLRRGVSPRHGGVAVYDDGVRRARTTPDHTGANVIEYSDSPFVLYGLNTETTEFGFRKIAVESCGVGVVSVTQGLVPGFGIQIEHANGRVYTSSGRVIEAESGTPAGVFSTLGGNFGNIVLPDPMAGRVYFITPARSGALATATLRVYDINTFLPLGTLLLPNIGPQANADLVSSPVRYGANGLAFRAGDRVILLQNALVGGTSGFFTPAPPPAPARVTLTGRVAEFINNRGIGGITVNVTGTLTTTLTTDADGNFTIPNVNICDSFTVAPTAPNYVFTPASVAVTNPGPSGQSLQFNAFPKTIGFAQSALGFTEGSHAIGLVVTRSTAGDTASVSYETAPGTASDRSDFTAAYGTLIFAPGETSKIITILLTDDVVVENAETFTVRLKDPVGAALNETFATMTVTINDTDTVPPTTSPLQDASFFVRRHYQDFLNRDPAADPAGFAFWIEQLAACDSITDPQAKGDCLEERHVNVSAAFFLSIEFQQTGYLVHRLYAASFPASASRPRGLPRLAEFLRDTQEVGRGVVVGRPGWEAQLETNKQEFLRRWVARPDFIAQYPAALSAVQFVDALFANSGVAPSAAERSAAVAAFGAGGTEGRALALRSVAESNSVYNAQYNPAFVLMQYFGYLRRNPPDAPEPTLDFAGYDFWLRKLNEFTLPGENVGDEGVAINRVRRAQMVKSFLVSGEYMSRFGPDNFDIRK